MIETQEKEKPKSLTTKSVAGQGSFHGADLEFTEGRTSFPGDMELVWGWWAGAVLLLFGKLHWCVQYCKGVVWKYVDAVSLIFCLYVLNGYVTKKISLTLGKYRKY